jgi:hypothetical protein
MIDDNRYTMTTPRPPNHVLSPAELLAYWNIPHKPDPPGSKTDKRFKTGHEPVKQTNLSALLKAINANKVQKQRQQKQSEKEQSEKEQSEKEQSEKEQSEKQRSASSGKERGTAPVEVIDLT